MNDKNTKDEGHKLITLKSPVDPISIEDQLKLVEHDCRIMDLTKIRDDADLQRRSDGMRWVQTKIKGLTEFRLSMTRPLDDSKQKIMKMFSEPLDKLDLLKRTYGCLIADYEEEVRAVRQKQQQAENEKAAKMEAAQKESLVSLAGEAVMSGNMVLADRYLTSAEHLSIEPMNVGASKRSGVSMRGVWRYKITDESKIPDEYWIIDEKRIGMLARNMKEQMDIPGVEAFEEKIAIAKGF